MILPVVLTVGETIAELGTLELSPDADSVELELAKFLRAVASVLEDGHKLRIISTAGGGDGDHG